MFPRAAEQDAQTRSSVVRPIATCSPSWRFFKRARWAFHGRAPPDFEPGRGLSAHYQPGMLNVLVNHRSGCSRLLSRFLAAREGFLKLAGARARAPNRDTENRFEPGLSVSRDASRRNAYTHMCALVRHLAA